MVKKKARFVSRKQRETYVDKDNPKMSVREQCKLLGINRSNFYYRHKEKSLTWENDICTSIDKLFMKDPCGVAKMTEYLKRQGYRVGRKLIRRLMRSMNLIAIYPKKKTSKRHPEHRIYPYLLRNLKIDKPDQVWAADITYIPLGRGFCYLTAIMDWYSRYVLSWQLSNTLDADFCVEALNKALTHTKPKIFNTDQGSQFTSIAFTGKLCEEHIAISMDGRGRVFDNIFIERLWRTVKYQNVYVQGYESMSEARDGLTKYFTYYNNERLHQGLNYRTPLEVYKNISFHQNGLHLKTA